MKVTKAFETEYGELVLLLENGQAIYQHPRLADQLYDSLGDSLGACEGTPDEVTVTTDIYVLTGF